MFFKPNLEKAQGIANKAINVFTSTIDELQRSNSILVDVIDDAELVIARRTSQIASAKSIIESNSGMISKLKEFCL